MYSQLKQIHHDNICVFIGIYVEPFNIITLWKYCQKGSLQVSGTATGVFSRTLINFLINEIKLIFFSNSKEIVYNCDMQLDLMFKYSILKDVVRVSLGGGNCNWIGLYSDSTD